MPAVPPNVGSYELLAPIGRGGMGTVYVAQREIVTGVKRLFAVKLLNSDPDIGREREEELAAEAGLAALVRHPNVIEVVEAAAGPDGFYLVMEYVAGGTLSSLLRQAHRSGVPIALPIVGRVICDALRGLHAAHQARTPDGVPLGMVHRDFSPQNLLIGRDGVTRLTDFGIAKATRRRNVTATGIVKGKVGYMAPEQARALPLDARSDLWSAGVVLWEALTSRRLFDAENDAAVILDIVSGADPPAPSSFRGDVPPALDAAVARALTRRREDRVATAAELADAIEAALVDVGLADDATVGGAVEAAVGEAIHDVTKAVDAATGPLAGTSAVVLEEPTRPVAAETTTDTALMTPVAGTRPSAVSRGRWPWLAAAVIASAIGIVALTPRESPQTATSGWLLPNIPAVSAAEPDTPSALVVIEADAPIAELVVGNAPPILLPTPRLTLQLPRPDGEPRLEARTRDGRSAVGQLSADTDRVVLRFGEQAPSPSRPPPAAARPRPAPKDDDLLAPTP